MEATGPERKDDKRFRSKSRLVKYTVGPTPPGRDGCLYGILKSQILTVIDSGPRSGGGGGRSIAPGSFRDQD